MGQVVAYKGSKTTENSKTFGPKEWSRWLKGGGHL